MDFLRAFLDWGWLWFLIGGPSFVVYTLAAVILWPRRAEKVEPPFSATRNKKLNRNRKRRR